MEEKETIKQSEYEGYKSRLFHEPSTIIFFTSYWKFDKLMKEKKYIHKIVAGHCRKKASISKCIVDIIIENIFQCFYVWRQSVAFLIKKRLLV